ncbi:Isochorismate synthase @ Menaquinone-specific isochorismate synthase [hydrothermal vent metagenome]|uniref:Isochorismate synthase @ Menaquinone-specific isochorismate synthase n=1 Tax=hydrothermal vent metagenome TaxID=652676 RepID=A0A3B0TNH7_9ZZZZ
MQKTAKSTKSVYEAISVCIKNNLTFAAYQLPQSKKPILIIQSTPGINKINDLSELRKIKGFLVSPFQKAECNPMFLIRPDYVYEGELKQAEFERLESTTRVYTNGNVCKRPKELSKTEYLLQIDKTINAIQENKFEKAVLSRVKFIQGDYSGKESEIFRLLCDSYPNAFVYIFRAGSQLWLGATPEPLACIDNGNFYTSSVAGTRSFNKGSLNITQWGNKERQEQHYVTDFIRGVLKSFQLNNYKQTGTYAKKAGNLLHLRTDFSFETAKIKGEVGRLVESLHPTSAVCGMPKKDTLKFITGIEKHYREYYSGYLGPVGMDGAISLFVNLRCMKVFKDALALYVGGGITTDSVPEEEWEETEIKAETLLSVIQKIY